MQFEKKKHTRWSFFESLKNARVEVFPAAREIILSRINNLHKKFDMDGILTILTLVAKNTKKDSQSDVV